MTYLLSRYSGIALLGSKCTDGHTKLARNYEFSTQDEDLTLCKTAVTGKYAHIGRTVVGFGKNEEINGWEDYYVTEDIKERMEEKDIVREEGREELFEVIPIPQ